MRAGLGAGMSEVRTTELAVELPGNWRRDASGRGQAGGRTSVCAGSAEDSRPGCQWEMGLRPVLRENDCAGIKAVGGTPQAVVRPEA